ncbi:tyrosine-type recombinase/integrase [Jeotgalibacillus proteolyticus]|uniref:tyrosine-type recombinase/integrase n=1 Tax=Jeotgalibacillus proteolyticus TaxID=2082395 RepID=UPI0014320B39|nr:site-specific integrase [Jeotgalibacillus proteolyticus]
MKTKKGVVWECMEDAPPDPVTGKRRRVSARDKNKGIAKAKVEEKIDQLTEHGLLVAGSKANITFEQLADLWLKHVTENKKNSTKYSYEYHVKRFNKYVSRIDVRSFTRKMYQNVLNAMMKDGYSENTIINAHAAAKKIFRQAVIWDIIKNSPADYVKPPKKLKTVEEIEKDEVLELFFEEDLLEKFLKASLKDGLKDDAYFLHTLSFSGMRVGENCALTEDDIDFTSNTIRITKTMYNISGNTSQFEITTPKTQKSIRTIPFGPRLAFIFKRQIAIMKEERLKNGKDFNPRKFLAVNHEGNPRTPRFIHYRIQRLAKLINYKGKANPHKFRHSHVSLMAAAGISQDVIMDRMGHSDSSTTRKVYTHVTKQAKIEAPIIMEEKFGKMLDF